MKRLTAVFYANELGKEPVRNWLLKLAKEDRIIVGKDIATVEFGWPIGMPTCKDLRNGVLEVRSTIKRGKVEARTYFSIEGNTMLLLGGHEGKKGQRDAIRLAIERLRDHEKRKLEANTNKNAK